jgi:jasmonate ZIM domain-containing protein
MAAVPTDSVSRRFAVACGVLSQYVRAGAAPVTTAATATVPATGTAAPLFLAPLAGAAASSLPQHEAGTAAAAASMAPQQLTIFYGGRVVVLDACPPEKAAELIRLAAAAQAAPAPEAPALVDMPIARKASLRRFLAKRKDRSSSTGTSSAAAAYDRQDDTEPEQQQPAVKKGKVVATREEACPPPSSSSWLALGLGGLQSEGGMLGR